MVGWCFYFVCWTYAVVLFKIRDSGLAVLFIFLLSCLLVSENTKIHGTPLRRSKSFLGFVMV